MPRGRAGDREKTSGSFDYFAELDRLAASVCVKTTTAPDAGPSRESEVCAPITATSLELTKADEDAHLAQAKKLCEEANHSATDDGGGCNARGASTFAPLGLFGVVGLLLAAKRRRNRAVC